MRNTSLALSKNIWRPWLTAGALAVMSAASLISFNAQAQASAPMLQQDQRSHEGHMMGRAHGEPGMLPMGRHQLDRLLNEVKATDAQRAQIKGIAEAAGKDIKALHEGARGLHEQALTLFAQPQIDAAAAEKLRQDMLARHDAVSKRVLQAALDVGRVLTPEQRAQWVGQMKARHEHMHEHMRERMKQRRGAGDGQKASQPAQR